jgi:hypothetical protein
VKIAAGPADRVLARCEKMTINFAEEKKRINSRKQKDLMLALGFIYIGNEIKLVKLDEGEINALIDRLVMREMLSDGDDDAESLAEIAEERGITVEQMKDVCRLVMRKLIEEDAHKANISFETAYAICAQLESIPIKDRKAVADAFNHFYVNAM